MSAKLEPVIKDNNYAMSSAQRQHILPRRAELWIKNHPMEKLFAIIVSCPIVRAVRGWERCGEA
jgi:hypothetical protein